MPALNFKAQFADDVRNGHKRQTVRAPHKDGRPHCKVGDMIKLYTGMHRLFQGSIDGEGRWRIPLRRLAGGETTATDNRQTFQSQGPNMKFAGIQSRALWMAISTLDEAA